MNKDQINNLAQKIAEVISAGSKSTDLLTIQESIERLSKRLDPLEASSTQLSAQPHNHWQTAHPSQDRFAVAEAIVDGLFGRDATEKTCTFEPNDRPCDHCSMCSSRGF